jgi:hypothetical protein
LGRGRVRICSITRSDFPLLNSISEFTGPQGGKSFLALLRAAHAPSVRAKAAKTLPETS